MITIKKDREVASLRAAVFVDRDGTLIDDTGYLGDPAGIVFYPGVPESLKRLREAGYRLVVVTNQSGIGRGYFDEETAILVNYVMVRRLADQGVVLDAIYYCPHHPDDGCRCRKPGILMIERACRDLGLDPGRSWMIGDTGRDVLAGKEAGLRSVLVETGMPDKGQVPGDVLRRESFDLAVQVVTAEGPP